ncbi:MAG: formylglycine-generating enzyme family protein [Deltaproteobacteria bacterium]|nr:formylglycine-generating enzyme family protein [Deltaproteobacteria bacterium]
MIQYGKTKIALLIGAVFVAALLAACSKGKDDMALVEEGEFTVGSDTGEADEKPARKVFVKSFYIDKYEVANGAYKKFVEAQKHRQPKDWEAYGLPEDALKYPVVFVSYKDAESYCKWAGKRLPTEDEWEKAARGADGRTYPWGSGFDKNNANTSLSGVIGTTRVGQYETGKSPYGAYDMAGNVWEWTTSDFNDRTKVVRGGSWGLTHRFATTYFRGAYNPDTAVNNLGFRCALDN